MNLPEALKGELNKPLPGIKYQYELAPKYRPLGLCKDEAVIEAAVSLIVVMKSSNEPEMLLIRRPEYDGHHSGQVSFPGGKRDKSDHSLLDTAIRETHEETGIILQNDEYIGKLSLLDIQVSGFRVHPHVFCINRKVDFKPDPKEVDYLIHFNIGKLLDECIIKTHRFSHNKSDFDAPYFAIENEIVWGATSMILSEFKEVLKRVIKKNPGLL